MLLNKNDIEFKSNVYRSNAFEFVYLDFYPFRANKLYRLLNTKDKHQIWIDMRGKRLLPIGDINNTNFNKYRKAKGGTLKREVYLKSTSYQLTERQRRSGSFIRYFARSIWLQQSAFDESEIIFEITKEDYTISTPLYKKVKLNWVIVGDKEQVEKTNLQTLQVLERKLKGIKDYLDPLEFYEEEITPYEEIQEKLGRLQTGY